MSGSSATDGDWLCGEVRAAAAAFADQLRTIDDGETKVPNLEWSVAELAAHLISLPAFYREQNESGHPFEPPDDWPTFSRSVRAHITETEPAPLADALVAETETMLDDVGIDPGAARVLYDQETTAADNAAGYLGELLLHGRDLALLTGADVPIDRRQAVAIIRQQLTLAPAFVDRERARRCDGVFGVSFRGGDDYTFNIDDGVLTVTHGRPRKADARVVADPVAYVLVALGRMSELRAGLLGKILGYGRKPWLLARLGKIRVDGV